MNVTIYFNRYTNGHVKVWDLQHFNDVTLTPSSTALVLDDAKETGTLANYVTCVGVHGALCAAGYSQGRVAELYAFTMTVNVSLLFICFIVCSQF